MNKTELIASVAEKSGLTKKAAEAGVNALLNTIKETLAAGEKIQLIGFGTFETRHRSERTAKNPRTGEPLVLPAATVPRFKPGQNLKDAVKDSTQ